MALTSEQAVERSQVDHAPGAPEAAPVMVKVKKFKHVSFSANPPPIHDSLYGHISGRMGGTLKRLNGTWHMVGGVSSISHKHLGGDGGPAGYKEVSSATGYSHPIGSG